MCECSDGKGELSKRADVCPYWGYEQTDMKGMAKGHCTAPGGSGDIDGCDPCCGAGFPKVKKPNVANENSE